MNYQIETKTGLLSKDSIEPQPGTAAALIVTPTGRVFTPDGSHSLGTCGTAERAIEFCRRIGWSWIVRDVHPTQDLAGAGEVLP
ncbi:hypothetical protein [Cyanobium sp. N5-Cardenillas]|uniref:hypothetical protein n=1 Tax=Cyanobium sp. N5-Cardenillas TaxID=2823720 RepID=UPI0020CD5335|nr:hypothetical protein [Cyanobium sp. N5-Cardenillas]MCP9786791.1 hypothetical protein [Cyanobium sp. N5-Cardenillas]